MRLPHDLVANHLFQFATVDELLVALGDKATLPDIERIRRLSEARLPPVVSPDALAALIGINAGLVWSFLNRPQRHYRRFTIPRGRDVREIVAPKVGIKIVQTWIGRHLTESYQVPGHVFGFIPGRSHVDAALCHSGAAWAYSLDIENFFTSTPEALVRQSIQLLGYDEQSAALISKLCCLMGSLPQGAPSSPPLSNICFTQIDRKIEALANELDIKVTRYADDIVFSGREDLPGTLQLRAHQIFEGTPYRIATQKERFQPLKGRIKVHGLLIKGQSVRLTKGYRNKLRAYNHVLTTAGARQEDVARLSGHINYGNIVAAKGNSMQDSLQVRRDVETKVIKYKYSYIDDTDVPIGEGKDEKGQRWLLRFWRLVRDLFLR